MPGSKAEALVGDLAAALDRLAAALDQPEDEFIRDAAIQRFEFCFELAWKAIQSVGRREGQEASSPRASLSIAWRNGWISDEDLFLDMLEERNRTSHTYREQTAREVFAHLPRFLAPLRDLHVVLSARLAHLDRR